MTATDRPSATDEGPGTAPAADQLPDGRHERLQALGSALAAHGFTVEVYGLYLEVSPVEEAFMTIEVWCAPRASDGGRLWFCWTGGTPICEAADVTGAVVAVKGAAYRTLE